MLGLWRATCSSHAGASRRAPHVRTSSRSCSTGCSRCTGTRASRSPPRSCQHRAVLVPEWAARRPALALAARRRPRPAERHAGPDRQPARGRPRPPRELRRGPGPASARRASSSTSGRPRTSTSSPPAASSSAARSLPASRSRWRRCSPGPRGSCGGPGRSAVGDRQDHGRIDAERRVFGFAGLVDGLVRRMAAPTSRRASRDDRDRRPGAADRAARRDAGRALPRPDARGAPPDLRTQAALRLAGGVSLQQRC